MANYHRYISHTIVALILQGLLSSLIAPSYAEIKYKPPQDLGTPRTSSAAATRGNCEKENADCYIVMVPMVSSPTDAFPRTVSDYPTFFMNIPEGGETITFKLFERRSNSSLKQIFTTSFKYEGKSGIVKFKLPKNSPALVANQSYTWKFSTSPSNFSCEGVLQRINLAPSLRNKIARANALEKAAIYAEAGIWFEALQTLAELRYLQPQNAEVQNGWTELLSAVNLAFISKQPMLKHP